MHRSGLPLRLPLGASGLSVPHWSTAWFDEISPRLSAGNILVACDFDGTLSPIAATPWEAMLPEKTFQILKKLAACPGVTLAIISGRNLQDLKSCVPLDGVAYSGNHGFEIEGLDLLWPSPDTDAHRAELTALIERVRQRAATLPGVFVEDKGFTASVHWRLASPEDCDSLSTFIHRIAPDYPGLRLTTGKSVWEFRPISGPNKGTAVRRLLQHTAIPDTRALYLGDDYTDESAFSVIPDGFPIRVGPAAPTAARLSAVDPDDVANFLFCLFTARVSVSPPSEATSG